jgi:hypothetical protein
VATVLSGVVTDWFGLRSTPEPDDASVTESDDTSGRAEARITAFNQSGSFVGQPPTAVITVENQGSETAENCLVHWMSGIVFTSGVAQDVTSPEFPLQASESRSFTLSSPVTWETGGLVNASARIVCSNTTSPRRVKQVLVVAS